LKATPAPSPAAEAGEKPGSGQTTRWRCTVCDYIHEGDAPPETCPVCGAPPECFVRVEDRDAGAEPRVAWHRVAGTDELPEDQVKTVEAEGLTFALTHFEGTHALLGNACPHQGGPLGQGTIEGGRLRCPWHGWEFHPLTGKASEGYEADAETFPCETREDGIYVGLPTATPSVRTVSDLMVETMLNWGVRHVFGMVGHSNLGLADAIRRCEEQGRLSYIGIRHEGAASFAASAYAKLTGRPAACFSIAGPGATNLLTGLWDARMDRVPVLALTGQVDTQVLGPGAFQEVDLATAFSSVAAWSQTVLPTSNHAELMTLALKNAVLQRNVAHLIFPNEVQTLSVEESAEPSGPEGRLTALDITPPEASIGRTVELLLASRRPAIIVGHGARFCMPPIIELAETLGCPVITTFKGKGLIPDDHPLACGVLGRSGTPIASRFMNRSDLLLVFGASFSKHTGINPRVPTVQVDYDPLILGKFHAVTVPVYGEIQMTANLLLERLAGSGSGPWEDQRQEIAERWRLWRAEKQRRIEENRGKGISSAALFAAMSQQVPDDAVITVDVGSNTYSFGHYFECKRQALLMSGYLGSIGFGYPAALGAWAAAPDRPIVTVTGDGGFAQYMGELCTAVKYGMNITHVLLNNSELGKISKEQRQEHFPVWATSLHNPDFSRYAQTCGAWGVRVTEAAQLEEALQAALAHEGPALVEVLTDPELV
jgi:thiamine pyrophosphate-dependent acetolactate synthase large subunit-like protein/nitrite reductase/ring-hydroxylating ferredoxin subunit